jgi:FkbM family methyltransferase
MGRETLLESLQSVLKAYRAGADLPGPALAALVGTSLSEAEHDAVRSQLAMLDVYSIDLAVQMAASYLEERAAQGSILDELRESVDRLFELAATGSRLPARLKHQFGAVSRHHEDVLLRAAREGALTREQALSLINDGRALTSHLGPRASADVALEFRTGDYNGIGQVKREITDVEFIDVVSVSTPGGPFDFIVSNEIELRQIGRPETDTTAWLDMTIEPASVFYDIGANVGYYSLYATRCVPGARAVCFEPAPLNIARLNANIRLNRADATMLAFCVAMSDATGLTTFLNTNFVAGGWSHRGINAPRESDAARTALVSGCVTYRLDDFVRAAPFVAPPTHIKIDVDGPELRVLHGAAETLRAPSLRHVLVETRDEAETAVIASLLGEHGFELTSSPSSSLGNRIFRRGD